MATFGLHGRLQAIAQGGGPQFPPPNVRSVLAAPEICVSSWLRPAALRHIAPAAGGITKKRQEATERCWMAPWQLF
jgi:hypothetical protein